MHSKQLIGGEGWIEYKLEYKYKKLDELKPLTEMQKCRVIHWMQLYNNLNPIICDVIIHITIW